MFRPNVKNMSLSLSFPIVLHDYSLDALNGPMEGSFAEAVSVFTQPTLRSRAEILFYMGIGLGLLLVNIISASGEFFFFSSPTSFQLDPSSSWRSILS